MSMTHLCGKFIVFDGGEGCGKSTQSRLLSERLADLGPLLVRDPGTTAVGEKIRAILLDPQNGEMSMRCEMLLYMAARAQMMSQIILPGLDQGRLVIGDRFVSSTLAYQLGGEGLNEAEIRQSAEVAIRGRWPDLTILLDMPTRDSLDRVRRAKDRIEQRPAEYHEQVRRNYLAQAQADPARYRVIPANRTPTEVHADVWRAIQSIA